MLLTDETYERMLLYTKDRSSKGELDFTFTDLKKSFPDVDPAEILAKIHLMKDEWIINEVSPNCYTINKILLDPIEIKPPAKKSSKKKNSRHGSTSSRNGRGNGKRKFVLTK